MPRKLAETAAEVRLLDLLPREVQRMHVVQPEDLQLHWQRHWQQQQQQQQLDQHSPIS